MPAIAAAGPSAQLQEQVEVKVLKKELDDAKIQGEGMVQLIEDSGEVARASGGDVAKPAAVSSANPDLGQKLDVYI